MLDNGTKTYILVGMHDAHPHAPATRDPAATRGKLVAAAVGLILENGYHATGVEAICGRAGVTKGGFFHHFGSKEDIGLAVIRWWSAMGTREYSKAWTEGPADPLQQLYAMLDIMEGFASRPGVPCVCAIGMMTQELAATHPEIRRGCADELSVWTGHVETLLRKARALHRPSKRFNPEQVAWFLNSLWQGSMLIAKTREDQSLIVHNLRHARAYLSTLFPESKSKKLKPTKRKAES